MKAIDRGEKQSDHGEHSEKQESGAVLKAVF
jgi:hypothetical protein